MSDQSKDYQYRPQMSRRDSIKWLAALAASSALPGWTVAAFAAEPTSSSPVAGHWPEVSLKPVTALGYGKDPNLIKPPESPWPRTLTQEQLTLVAVLSDILVPAVGNVPSATQVKVPDVLDEWVSAPYERQQKDRAIVLPALMWIDDEARLRFGQTFSQLDTPRQMQIIDDIAYDSAMAKAEFTRIVPAFSHFRQLVLAAFFCSPQGMRDLGYQGNVAIAGDYPGPSQEAMQHLDGILDSLGLKEFAYQS